MEPPTLDIIEGDKLSFISKLKEKITEGWTPRIGTYSCIVLGGKIVYSIFIDKENNSFSKSRDRKTG